MKLCSAAIMAVLALGSMSRTAGASYTFDFEEVGNDVVLTGSGSLNLTGSRGPSTGGPFGVGVTPSTSNVYVGAQASADGYAGITNPKPFGTGVPNGASNPSGDYVGISAADGTFFVPAGYVSGTLLLSSETFLNATFASLGLSTGTFTYSIASDKFVVQVGPSVGTVPLPASAPMFGAGLIALGAAGYAAKRKRAAAA